MEPIMRQLFIYVDDSYNEIKEYFCKNKIQNIFLVCGKSFFKLSISKYLKKLQDTCGINIEYFSNFSPNPQYESVSLRIFHEKDSFPALHCYSFRLSGKKG